MNSANIVIASHKLSTPTRLEFSWLLGPAVSGGASKPISYMRNGTDMNGVYPIKLLRFFLPTPADILRQVLVVDSSLTEDQIKNSDIRSPKLNSRFYPWWLENTLGKIQALGFSYDTICGKSGFGAGCCGGSFKFDDFLKAAAQAVPGTASQPTLINSFDLASIVQLALSLLVDRDGEERQESDWVCRSPYGISKPGLPFGFTMLYWPPGINNPFFTGLGKLPLCLHRLLLPC
jgi:hypothetical protein